jgi:hypothetical protein
MKSGKQKVIVVLGMHRSGTSTVARGLQALGVDLGDNLLPQQPDNPRGFWEDAGLLAINEELLASCGLVWHSFGAVDARHWNSPGLDALRLRAINYVRRNFNLSPVWGFKDPRTARVLPFWQSVFKHLGLRDSYVITVRNPISVARSLETRNQFSADKSYLLWLDHMVPSVLGTFGKSCVVTNYDTLLASPKDQLMRIARALGLRVGKGTQTAIGEFVEQFIEPDLRHSVYGEDDLRLDPSIGRLTRVAYELLLKRSKDQARAQNVEFKKGWKYVKDTYSEMLPVTRQLEKLSAERRDSLADHQLDLQQLASLNQAVAERDNLLASLNHSVAERDQQIASLQQQVANRDHRLTEQLAQLDERGVQIVGLNEAIARQNQDLARLNEAVSERVGQLTQMGEQLGQREQQLASLNQAVAERDNLLASLNHSVAERDQQIASLQQQVANRDHRLTEQLAQLDERGVQIVGLNEAIARQNQDLARLNEAVSERVGQLTQMGEQLGQREQQIAEFGQELAKRDGRIGDQLRQLTNRERQLASLNETLDARNAELKGTTAALEQAHTEIAAARTAIESGRQELEGERAASEHYKNQNQGLLMKVFAYEHESRSLGIHLGRRVNRIAAWMLPQHTVRARLAHLMRRAVEVYFERGVAATYALSKKHVLSWIRFRLRNGVPISAGGYLQHAVPPELEEWIVAREPSVEALQRQVKDHFPYSPLISVILPVHKVPSAILEKALRSLMNQTYQNWEACVAYADVGNYENWALITRLAQEDIRIRGERLDLNGGISINSNASLLMARGEFLALLDHDDELTPWAFHDIVEKLNEDAEIDFVYSDKDSIDEQGSLRLNALFKPEWSPEMLYSVNYLTHLCVMRKQLVEEVGGWRPETDGAQDWDIFCRVTERSRRVARVPGIHYHWRIIGTSVSTGLGAKPYAAKGQLRTQQDRIARLGLPATVFPHAESGFRVVWDTARLAGIDVVVDGDVPEARLQQFLSQDLKNQNIQPASVKVVCREGMRQAGIDRLSPQIEFMFFSGGEEEKTRAMLEASEGTGQVLIFLSARIGRLGEDALVELAGWAGCHPEIAFAGALAMLDDDTVVEAGLILNGAGEGCPLFRGTPLRSWGWLGGPLWYRNCSAVSPDAVAFKRSIWQSTDLLPSMRGKDWRSEFLQRCRIATKSRYRGMVDPHARIYFGSMPAGTMPLWDDSFREDPYFNPAFSSVSPLRLQS